MLTAQHPADDKKHQLGSLL